MPDVSAVDLDAYWSRILRPGISIDDFGSDRRFDPELWRFMYRARPYLSNVENDDLALRYRQVRRNIISLVEAARNAPPPESFLSSWFWLRTLEQLREEYRRRRQPEPDYVNPFPDEVWRREPVRRPRHPNAADFLVRYGSMDWLPAMLRRGRVQVKAAAKYKGEDMNEARRADELRHHTIGFGRDVRVGTRGGASVPIIGDIRITHSVTDGYYVLCLSSEHDHTLFHDFKADGCLLIHNPEAFAARLECAFAAKMKGRLFTHFPVEYQDPFNSTVRSIRTPGAVKDFSYAYQKEYRYLWGPLRGSVLANMHEAFLGDLSDIAELVPRVV